MSDSTDRRFEDARDIVRFTPVELAQHWVLMLCLIVLALTGLALLFHETWAGRMLIAIEGGVEMRGIIHRGAAVVLMLLVVWHFFYVVFTERGHRQLMELRPSLRDVRLAASLLAYHLGRRAEPPGMGRFTPMQKLQYWGAGLGSLLMIATGLALWFNTQTMAVAPKWFLDLTTIVHGHEGMLLFVLLFVWHLYIVHLSPGNFPFQRTFLDGKISRARLWRDHRDEYRALLGDRPPQARGDGE